MGGKKEEGRKEKERDGERSDKRLKEEGRKEHDLTDEASVLIHRGNNEKYENSHYVIMMALGGVLQVSVCVCVCVGVR